MGGVRLVQASCVQRVAVVMLLFVVLRCKSEGVLQQHAAVSSGRRATYTSSGDSSRLFLFLPAVEPKGRQFIRASKWQFSVFTTGVLLVVLQPFLCPKWFRPRRCWNRARIEAGGAKDAVAF
uniref:Uncharacterized protein n=1 Tax=Aegilops tauschii TaxID=37682 RepID=M8ATG6_AEGTA